jgi:hypothetical protein
MVDHDFVGHYRREGLRCGDRAGGQQRKASGGEAALEKFEGLQLGFVL